ncbi:MAG: serine protease [Lysobacterales bacterium]
MHSVPRILGRLIGSGVAAVLCLSAPAQAARADLLAMLDAAGAGAHSPYVNCSASADAPEVVLESAVQYLPQVQDMLAWRVLQTSRGPCLRLDWPQQVDLSPQQAQGLQRLGLPPAELAEDLRASAYPSADVRAVRERERDPFWQTRPPIRLAADRPSLPWCPVTLPSRELLPLSLPDPVAPLALRVRPHRCNPGSRPTAGSGVLLSPDLAMTAAHVVLTSEGVVCDRYRLVPGGRRYSDPPAAPFGTAMVSRAFLSERGGWHRDADAPPDLNQRFAERTAHDFAFLVLDQPADLPSDLAWPRLRFGAPRVAPGLRVLRAGYGVIGPAGRIAPGAAVNLFGQSACPRGAEPFQRFALWMSAGASGGPIWRWPATGAPLELLSLAVRMETFKNEQHETLGPRFDQTDYRRLLDLLAQTARERAAQRAAARLETPTASPTRDEAPAERRETARSKIYKRQGWRVKDCLRCSD